MTGCPSSLFVEILIVKVRNFKILKTIHPSACWFPLSFPSMIESFPSYYYFLLVFSDISILLKTFLKQYHSCKFSTGSLDEIFKIRKVKKLVSHLRWQLKHVTAITTKNNQKKCSTVFIEKPQLQKGFFENWCNFLFLQLPISFLSFAFILLKQNDCATSQTRKNTGKKCY